MNFDLTTIIPVAPRDLGFLPACIGHLERSVKDLTDSKTLSRRFGGWLLKIVVDGPARASELEAAYKALRSVGVELSYAFQVWGLDRPYGAGIARNFALATCEQSLEAASCDLVTFMDADDVPMPWWARALTMPCVDHVESQLPGLPFVYAGALSEQKNPDNGRVVRWSFPLTPPERIRAGLQQANLMLTTAVCTMPQVLQRAGGFEPHLICGEDGNLWRRATHLVLDNSEAVAALYGVDLPVTFYKPRPDGQSRGLHAFSDKAFHLDKTLYGPMGQNLDDKATERSAAFTVATTTEARIEALCGDAKGTLWKAS